MVTNPKIKASLFTTCLVDQLFPEVGVSTVRLLRRLGVEVDFPKDQTCCGQPVFNSGQSTTGRRRSGANGSTAPSARAVAARASGPTSRHQYWLRKMAFKGTNLAEFEQSAGRSWSGSPASLVRFQCLPRFDQPGLAGQAGALGARGRGRVDPARADSSGRPACQALRLPGSAVRPPKRIGLCCPDIRASSPGNASFPMPRADRMGITRGLPIGHISCSTR